MDYSQYLIPLTRLNDTQQQALLGMVASERHRWNNTDTSFRPRRGFKTYRDLVSRPPALTALLDVVEEWLPKDAFRGYEANQLEAGAVLEEHTDIAAKPDYKHRAHEITKFHKLNVALQGEAEYWFRRDPRQPLERAEPIRVGDATLFNNYVYHEVRCTSKLPRINLTLFYSDPTWAIKFAVYERLGIDTNGY